MYTHPKGTLRPRAVTAGLCLSVIVVSGALRSPLAGDAMLPVVPEPVVDEMTLGIEDQEADNDTIYRVCRITAYCDIGTTASGVPSGVGQCAAPEDIPFGTEVYIPALDRTFIVTDRTHKRFRKNTVDIFISSCDECLEFGRHYLECEFDLSAATNPIQFRLARFANAQ